MTDKVIRFRENRIARIEKIKDSVAVVETLKTAILRISTSKLQVPLMEFSCDVRELSYTDEAIQYRFVGLDQNQKFHDHDMEVTWSEVLEKINAMTA